MGLFKKSSPFKNSAAVLADNGFTDAYIEALLREPEEKADPKRTFVMKDVRVFVNTIRLKSRRISQRGKATL